MKKLFCIAAIALAACSPKPGDVKPSFVDEGRFAGLSCQQVQSRRIIVRQNVEALSKAQRNARRGDVIGVILTGIPVVRVSGGNVAKDLAAAKGELEALNRTGCP
jgi:hypothetical protein